jgi:biopolymer transport protein ExbD
MFEDDLNIVQTPRIKHLWDVTNLIDVMIILLIFLIGTTTFSKMGIPLNQPASSQAVTTPSPVLEFDVDSSGTVYFQGNPIDEVSVRDAITTALAKDPTTTVRINTDRSTQTQSLFKVLDWCRDSGASKFSFGAIKK